jgi:hypothetical protein
VEWRVVVMLMMSDKKRALNAFSLRKMVIIDYSILRDFRGANDHRRNLPDTVEISNKIGEASKNISQVNILIC